jgi:CheY-like chemotaxis protein
MKIKSNLRKHILIVEDEPDFAALVESTLKTKGYSTAMAYNGEEAFSRVCEKRPDLITLDIQMPRKTGVLFYRQLKSNTAFRNIPVLVITGLTRDDREMENMIHTLMQSERVPSPDGFLEKPIDGQNLISVVENFLQTKTVDKAEPTEI